MSTPFIIGLTEAIQCAVLLALVLEFPGISQRKSAILTGVTAAFVIGFPLSYIPALASSLPLLETWTNIRYLTETIIFASSLIFLSLGRKEIKGKFCCLFALGFLLFFFESVEMGFVVHNTARLKEAVASTTILAVAGTIMGFAASAPVLYQLKKIQPGRFFTLPGLFVALGTLMFAMGGAAPEPPGGLMLSMQRGTQHFLESLTTHLQEVFLIAEHPFIPVPYTALAGFLSGEGWATTLVVLALMTPPIGVLWEIFSRPDPVVKDIEVGAQRRLTLAFFRKETLLQAAPALISFIFLFIALHAVNASLNPMNEPDPIPVRESELHAGNLEIPLADKRGTLADGQLRKYIYYYGDKQIIFLAVMKPDGTLGVALDECEICNPAEWNKDARGYAQRGENLVCKYCMTPIPTNSVNKPGGCNPIPVIFSQNDEFITLGIDELVRVYRETKALDKKGSHL